MLSKSLNAFSLLELIIVMAVIAVIMGISWSGIQSFRATSELQNAYSELIGNFKSLLNKSKNSISTSNSGQTPDYYFITFINNKYFLFNCTIISTFTNNIRCVKDSTFFTKSLNTNIRIYTSSCQGVGFARLSSKVVAISNLNISESVNNFDTTIRESGICKLDLNHSINNISKNIEFNLDTNTNNI